ncbi:hypothetical protein [Halalkalicoccus jeotgali]|uniref:Uncharacterized protein n=1 Tax=Halalkalicoccus jeotgali (strain DSM 18796 / CECT 7217 / JCM 14584 / KCTC 4019 / B3) TaxID=795797 RepID=D8J9Z2_HALJB|nr:hypothetical protein [Halalkalicoccus jeotgali]ADJ14514.1 hypothetical protein HacjB3_05615 [Halalkalicoccus jeotgali B3]ELY40087.1 hypothetical protein C497_03985 [Halalkalicoccus jeotgali B3]
MAIAVDSTVEMDTTLHHNAVNVLLAIYDAEDETANTSQIGAVTGLSSANISGGHAQTLEREGLIERAGSVESSAPRDTNVYTVTHRGRKEAKRLLNETDAEVPMSDGEKLALLNLLKDHAGGIEQAPRSRGQDAVSREELKELRQEVAEVKSMLESHEERLNDHDDGFENAWNTLEKVVDRVVED